MRLKKIVAAATLPAMMATPVAAANPAASLSLRGDSNEAGETAASAATQADAGSYAGGSSISTPLLLGGLAIVLIIVGAVALGSGHNDNHPASA